MYVFWTYILCMLARARKPLDRDFNVASFEINNNIKVLNLAINQMLINSLSTIPINGQNIGSLIEFFLWL